MVEQGSLIWWFLLSIGVVVWVGLVFYCFWLLEHIANGKWPWAK